jgi:hypothetical protein
MQRGAARLEALLSDSEGLLLRCQGLAVDILNSIDDLQQEMDKLAPK